MRFLQSLMVVFVASFMVTVQASETKTLLYMHPSNYQHGVRLSHPYYEYWITQGPIVEPIALSALQTKSENLSLCQSGETANRIVKIIPSVFYNPQLRVLHGQVIANVYSGGGSLLGAYLGKAQQNANIDIAAQQNLKKVYTLAMQDLMQKLDMHLKADVTDTEVKLPCHIVAGQPEPGIGYF